MLPTWPCPPYWLLALAPAGLKLRAMSSQLISVPLRAADVMSAFIMPMRKGMPTVDWG